MNSPDPVEPVAAAGPAEAPAGSGRGPFARIAGNLGAFSAARFQSRRGAVRAARDIEQGEPSWPASAQARTTTRSRPKIDWSRLPLAKARRETRVGLAALFSFLILVGALVLNRKPKGDAAAASADRPTSQVVLSVPHPTKDQGKDADAAAEKSAPGDVVDRDPPSPPRDVLASNVPPTRPAGIDAASPPPADDPIQLTGADGPPSMGDPAKKADAAAAKKEDAAPKAPPVVPEPEKAPKSAAPPAVPPALPASDPKAGSTPTPADGPPPLGADLPGMPGDLPPIKPPPTPSSKTAAPPAGPADPLGSPGMADLPGEPKPADPKTAAPKPADPTSAPAGKTALSTMDAMMPGFDPVDPAKPAPSTSPTPAPPESKKPAVVQDAARPPAQVETKPLDMPPMTPEPIRSAPAAAPPAARTAPAISNVPPPIDDPAAPPPSSPQPPQVGRAPLFSPPPTAAAVEVEADAGAIVIPNLGKRRTTPSDDSATVDRPSVFDRPVADAPMPKVDVGARDKVDPILHPVQTGENFWTISRLYYNSGRYYKALHAANRKLVPEINKLYIGTVIKVPPVEELDPTLIDPPKRQAAAAPGTRTRDAEADPAPAGGSKTRDDDPARTPVVGSTRPRGATRDREDVEAPAAPVYKVRPHDTLRSIAREMLGDSRRSGEILSLNRDVIPDPARLVTGQSLVLPEDAAAVRRDK